MKTVLDLLQQKNKYLERFEQLSARQYLRLCAGDFTHIRAFSKERQKLLKSIEHIDSFLKQQKFNTLNPAHKQSLEQLLEKKKKIIKAILNKDLLIHARLNEKEDKKFRKQIAG